MIHAITKEFNNTLVVPILAILNRSEDGVSEYALMKLLEEQGFELPGSGSSNELALFQRHFIIMNALYELQLQFEKDRIYLTISALCIKIEDSQFWAGEKQIREAADQKLREYYLDWSHYSETTEEEVNALLNSFWQRFYAQDKKLTAYETLGLSVDASWQDVQQKYRQLANQLHPDKGGCKDEFIIVLEAYELLKCCYSR